MHLCLHCMNEIKEDGVLLCQTCSIERGFSCTQCGGTKNLVKITTMKPHKVYHMCTKCQEDIKAEQEEMMQQDMKEYRSIVWAGLH